MPSLLLLALLPVRETEPNRLYGRPLQYFRICYRCVFGSAVLYGWVSVDGSEWPLR
jgi:hypothetical protein